MAGRRPDLRVRAGRDADARGGRGLGDARALAAGLLALAQPPDPERPGPAAPHAGHAVHRDHRRGGDRYRAGHPAGPRLPRRDLRVRRAHRAAAGAPERHRAALPRARPRPALRDAVLRRGRRGEPPAARGAGCAAGRDRLRQRARLPRGRTLRRGGVDGGRARALRDLPHHAGQVVDQARDRPGVRAATRPRPRRRPRRVRLDPGAAVRHRPRRRHHADGRAFGR